MIIFALCLSRGSVKKLYTNDIRPGLVSNHSLKRKHEIEKQQIESKKRNFQKPVRQLEEENRLQGLSNALPENNKGFAMLQKMGYKPGMSLGKKDSGIKQPIPLVVKANRTGLGKEAEDKIQAEKKKAFYLAMVKRKAEDAENAKTNFQQYSRNKIAQKRLLTDLRNSQKACEQLDKSIDIEVPHEPWFWPHSEMTDANLNESDDDDNAEKEEEEELDPSEKLEILTAYLRSTHFYCVWCGTAHEGENFKYIYMLGERQITLKHRDIQK
ncbi:G patch domain-containing protein 11-like isoform X2 [Tachypleus tridentatus]|uniref:G patch domain-containing protein 11-like isoform X2 n=1 Tax=Tachypleus tridentatus TaxID=6853 RepID=UPI003FD67E34